MSKQFDPSILTSRAGQPLTGDWRKDPGLAAVRGVYRMCKREPRGTPLREAIEDWERARKATGSDFAVPPEWAPKRRPKY